MKPFAEQSPILSELDHQILKEVWRHGFRTFPELYDLFLKNYSRSWRYKVMQRLVRLDYLIEQRTVNGLLVGWKATHKRDLPRNFNPDQAKSPQLRAPRYFSTYNHDFELRRLLDRLAMIPAISNIRSEGDVRKEFFEGTKYYRKTDLNKISLEVPDSVFTLSIHNKPLSTALELELSAKSHRRIEDKIEGYIHKNKFDLAIYVCKDGALRDKILQIYDDVFSHSPRVRFAKIKTPVYFALLPELKSDLQKAKFVSLHDTFSFQDIV